MVTKLPVGPEYPGMTAGPSFEVFFASGYLLPHTWQAWVLIHERLQEAGAFLERLVARHDSPQGLERTLSSLKRLADKLAAKMPRLPEREVKPPLSWVSPAQRPEI
jgi:hypothetical protein